MLSQVRFALAVTLALVASWLIPDALAQKPRLTLKGHKDEVAVVSFSPDGKKLLTCSPKASNLWDVATGKKVASLGKPRDSVVLDSLFLRLGNAGLFSSDSKWLALPGEPAAVYEVATGKKKFTVDGTEEVAVFFAFSPDARRLAGVVYQEDEKKGALRFWNVASGKESKELARKLTNEELVQIVYSPDGKSLSLLILGKPKKDGDDQTRTVSVEILDAQTGKSRHRIEIPWSEAERGWVEVAFSPDSERFSVAGKIYEVRTGKPQVTLARQKDDMMRLWGVRFSSDGKTVLGVVGPAIPSASEARWWDAATGKELLTKESNRLALSGDGKTLYLETGNDFEIWDMNSRKRRLTRKQPGDDSIFSAALSPDGKILALGMLDGVVHVSDVPPK